MNHSHVDCTCPDSIVNRSVCKHIGALTALGLVARTTTPAARIEHRLQQPSAPARRRHKPDLPRPADPTATFAAGFRAAVSDHIAAMAHGGVA